MAPILKSLTILLATATIISGGKIKKSEKRGIADFGSGFSTSRLEGSGIKISTDFGKEMTLEEFRQNGYSFGNNNNADLVKNLGSSFGQDIASKYGLGGDFHLDNLGKFALVLGGINADFAKLNLGGNIPQQFINQGNAQGAQQYTQGEINNENTGADAAQAQNIQGNNGESSSVSYITQNIPVPVPQPYQVVVNRPVPVPVPQPVHINVPRLVTVQVPQPYPVQINKPYPVNVNRPIPVPIPHPVPVPQRQEVPIPVPQPYPVEANGAAEGDGNNQIGGTQERSLNAASGDEQKYLANALQNEASSAVESNQISHQPSAAEANQIISHESESTANNGFVPSSGPYAGHASIDSLQQQATGHEQSSGSLSQAFHSGISQGSHSSLASSQQGLQSDGHHSGVPQELSANIQQGHQGFQSIGDNLTGHQHGQPSFAGIQQGGGHPSFAGLQQGSQSFGEHGLQHGSQLSLAGLQQSLQSAAGHSSFAGLQQGHPSFAGHQQNFQPSGGHPSLAGLERSLQSVGGHASLASLQQSLQSGGHSALAGLPHGLQSSTINHIQAASSQPKISGYSVSIGSEQGQQSLGHIQQALQNSGVHGYPVESHAYGAKM